MSVDPPAVVTLDIPLSHAVIDAIVDRIADRVERSQPAVEPWVGVADVAAHLGCRRQRIYDLIYRRRSSGIPHRKEGGRLLFRLSEIDCWIESGRAA